MGTGVVLLGTTDATGLSYVVSVPRTGGQGVDASALAARWLPSEERPAAARTSRRRRARRRLGVVVNAVKQLIQP